MSSQLTGLVAVALLVLLTAYLSALETVLSRLSLVRALRLDEEDRPRAGRLVWLLEHRASALNVVLTLTVVSRIAAAAAAAAIGASWAGVPGAVAGVAVLVVVSLLIGEIAPRTLTLRHLEGTALRVAGPGMVLTRVLEPLAWLFVGTGRALVRTRGAVSGPYAPDDEVREHLDGEDEDERLEDDELAMIHSIFELGDTVAREIMVPRPDMITVAEDDPLETVVTTIIEHGYSRIPVHRDAKDHIVGVVYAKDVLKRLALRPAEEGWIDLVRDPTFVPETKGIDDLLRSLQEQTVHLAIVVDEYGAVAGLVTIEDILEEIVGEIVDEHDHEEALIEVLDDRRIRVDARLPVDELNDLLDTDLPDEGWDTVGGLVFGMLGHVPSPGESVDIDGLRMVAERVQGRRVAKVVVSRTTDPTTEPAEGATA